MTTIHDYCGCNEYGICGHCSAEEVDHDEHRAVDAMIAEEREAEIVPMKCLWCRKRPIPAGRLESCGPECFRKLQKADRALAKLDRQTPRENIGGIGS